MPHIHWVARQNKLETPKEKDGVNKREVHECDVRVRDPDAMVGPPTPKPTFKAEALVRVPRPSSQVVKKTLSCGSGIGHGYVARAEILELKQKSAAPQQRPRPYVPNRISTGHPPHPNHTPTHHTRMRWASARSRCDKRPTNTQDNTQNRSPRQGAADHRLKSQRRRCAEEVACATVNLRELKS